MKLYVTETSPYARMARIMVLEKGLEDRVEILPARTRQAGSPYYEINPSGRVPYLICDDDWRLEESQLICAHFDHLAGPPAFAPTLGSSCRPPLLSSPHHSLIGTPPLAPSRGGEHASLPNENAARSTGRAAFAVCGAAWAARVRHRQQQWRRWP